MTVGSGDWKATGLLERPSFLPLTDQEFVKTFNLKAIGNDWTPILANLAMPSVCCSNDGASKEETVLESASMSAR